MWTKEQSPKANEVAQQPQAAVPAPASQPTEERRVVAWFGKSVILKGHLISSEDIRIEGHVEGTIEVPQHTVTIGPGAAVRATIMAKNVTVRGAVTGKITATDRVEIGETGSVDGDIISPRFAIADGAVIQGRIETLASHKGQTTKPTLTAVG